MSLKRRMDVEGLEVRQLMTAQVLTEYPLPTSTSPAKIALAPDGSLWFSQNGASPAALGRVTTSGQLSQPVTLSAGDTTFGLTIGPDNNFWTTEQGATPAIAQVTPTATNASFTEFTNFAAIPGNPTASHNPDSITKGPQGDTSFVWFTDSGSANAIGQVAVNGAPNQAIQEFPLASNRIIGTEITPGPAGDSGLYFLETTVGGSQSFIGRIDDTTHAITDFPVTNPDGLTPGTPTQLIAGPGDAIYFTEQNTDRIGKLDLATGVVNDNFYDIPNVTLPGSDSTSPAGPTAITIGTDGSVYVTESNVGAIARLTLNSAGAVTSLFQYTPFSTVSGVLPGITLDQTGDPWFTEGGTSRIGSLAIPTTPLQAQPASINGVVNTPLTNVPIATFTDPSGPSSSTQYTATINWGDGTSLDTNVTFNPVGTSGTFQLLASHTYTTTGTFTPVVTINDLASPRTATVFDAATISKTASPALQVQPAAINGVINSPLTNVPIATFTDPSGPNPSTQYTATIDWGDGSAIDTDVTFNPDGTASSFQLLASHTYTTAGNFTPIVTITDSTNNRSATVFDSAHISVSPAGTATTITAVEGTPFLGTTPTGASVPVATFPVNPATPGGYSATIDWGDGTAQGGATITGPTLVGGVMTDSIIGTHTFATSGTYNGSVTLKNPDGSVTVFPLQSVVNPLAGNINDLQATAGTPISGFLGEATPSPFGLPVNPTYYSATIDWGDGVTTAASAASGAVGGMDVFGNHVYAVPGTYTLTVIFGDAGAPNLFAETGTVTVTGLAGTPIAQSGVVGQPVGAGQPIALETASGTPAPIAGYYSATIDYGDGSPTSVGTLVAGANGGFTVDGPSHTYQMPGTYTVNILIGTTGQPNLAVLHTTITVTEAPISVTGMLNPASDTGISNTDGITRDITPNFQGTTAPDATVRIYAIPASNPSATPVLIGLGVANGISGAFSITSSPLADGIYDIETIATSKFGTQTATTFLESGTHPLVIDTVAPKITAFAVTNTLKGQFQVTYQDELGGLVVSDLVNGANYDVQRPVPTPRPLQHFLVSTLSATAETTPTTPVTVTGSVFNGHYLVLRGGEFIFNISGTGITDVAGNALDGEFYGTFPTGDGHPGGNFKAEVIIRQYTPSGPLPLTTANPAHPGTATISPTALAPKLKKAGLNAPPTSLPGVNTGEGVSATEAHTRKVVTKLSKAKPAAPKHKVAAKAKAATHHKA